MEASDWVRLIFIVTWRFFTGHHMDGKMRRPKGGSVLPRYSDYFWNRYSRRKRAFIRVVVFFGTVGVVYGSYTNWNATRYTLLALTPFILWRIYLKIVNALTMVTSFQDSDGVKEQYRIVRPKVRSAVAKLKPAKLRVKLPDGGPVPPEVARAIMAENAEDNGEPILNMRIAAELEADKNDTGNGSRKRRRASRVGEPPGVSKVSLWRERQDS